MSLTQTLQNLVIRIATEFKTIRAEQAAKIGDLQSLTTEQKATLVASLNELKSAIDTATAGGLQINDDSASGTTTYSSSKIESFVNDAIARLVNGADESSDTLKELADRIGALAQADAGLVSFKQTQVLETTEKQQVCSNIGVGDPEVDLVTVFTNALS